MIGKRIFVSKNEFFKFRKFSNNQSFNLLFIQHNNNNNNNYYNKNLFIFKRFQSTKPLKAPKMPAEPKPEYCCGNGCSPCVYETYYEDLEEFKVFSFYILIEKDTFNIDIFYIFKKTKQKRKIMKFIEMNL